MNATTVSVIIASAGRAASLTRCLDSLRAQKIEGGIEVVVALDGVGATRADAIQHLRARNDWPWPLRWIDPDVRRGAAAARNRGAGEARGRYFIFLDDDMVAEPDFVAAHLQLLAQNPNTVIVGAIKTRCIGSSGVYRHAIERSWDHRHDRLTRESDAKFQDCFSANLAMATDVFRRVGGFDESLPAAADFELGLRLARAHVQMLYGSCALAVQRFRKRPSEMMRDYEDFGLAHVRLWRSYPEARSTLTFAVSPNGRWRTRWLRRWLRKWALNIRWRCESLAFVLAWLPATHLTEGLHWFLCDLARARGARREFADEDQWTALTEGTLLLCYHKFSPAGGKRSGYAIPTDRFERQIEVLKSAGYRFVTLRDCINAWQRNEVIAGRTAVITIDDGTADLAEIAAPILRRRALRAVLYVVRDRIGASGCLSAAQIKSLAAEGFEIGSHSLSHPWLTRLGEERQRQEIAASRSALSDVTGNLPETFAYPYGDCDATSEHLAQQAGYAAALGVKKGNAYLHSPPFDLPRIVVDGRWPLWLFKLIVLGGFKFGGLRDGDVLKAVQTRVAAFLTSRNRAG
jgi:peptidoglycan/xylan/chitin deacetylase (PgdA/CDA1 family)/glycosyltransferase involved in cell wall biosynthesis